MKIDLGGEVALVTGASRGIGCEIAKQLGQAGAWVWGTATTEKGANKINNDFSAAGFTGEGLVLDVSSTGSIAGLEDKLKTDDKLPSILVNNAGITRDNLMMRMKDEEWEQVIQTNLDSIYRLTRICLRPMMKKRHGRIINITSVVALSGNPGQVNYAAAKAGMIGFSRALAKEIGSRGITVNCVAPGFIKTDMTNELTEEQHASLLQQIPAARLGTTGEVASAVTYLASAHAGYISGAVINVNGGLYMA